MKTNSLTINYRNISDLQPYEKGLRNHSRKQRRKAKSLLRKNGQLSPAIVDQNNVIIDGHLIYETLKELGHEEIAVVVAADRSPAEIKALRLALNRLPEDTVWDKPALALEFQELMELSFDMELTGFEGPEIDACLTIGLADNIVEDDPLADLNENVALITKEGDLWQLGEHRLLCGNSLAAESYELLMAKVKAHMVLCDAPYNVSVRNHVCGNGLIKHPEFAMASGEMSKSEFTQFLITTFKHLEAFSVDGSLHYHFMDWRHIGEIHAAGQDAYTSLINLCVWNKDNGGMGSFYRSKHELVFVFKKGTERHINNVELGKHGRNRTNVWDYPGVNTMREGRLEDLAMHPTVKPTALVADAILDASNRGDVILDCFGGSGTTLMAAERTGRRARLIEISPLYVDGTIRRWQKATGLKAVLISTGQTFSEVETASSDASNTTDGEVL